MARITYDTEALVPLDLGRATVGTRLVWVDDATGQQVLCVVTDVDDSGVHVVPV